jgi:Carboxypeptidase regulatory-like domain
MNYARSIAVVFSLLFFFVFTGAAQDSKKETQLRTLRGVVTDKSENPLPNSVVFLKNLRTNAVRSNFADTEGNYRFSGLDPNADYEVHAEFEGAKSSVRNVSSLDSRKEMVINLKIERKKS